MSDKRILGHVYGVLVEDENGARRLLQPITGGETLDESWPNGIPAESFLFGPIRFEPGPIQMGKQRLLFQMPAVAIEEAS